MDRVIYIDSLFVINFCIDFLALQASASISSAAYKLHRVFLASLVGAVYSVGAAYFSISGIAAALAGAGVAAFMCFIAFDFSGFQGMAMTLGAFAAVNLSLGGAVSAVGNFAAKDGRMGAFTIIAVVVAACVAMSGMVKGSKEKASQQKVKCDISICGKSKSLTLLSDSGNILRDPFNGKRVIVVSGECFREAAHLICEGKLDELCPAHPRIIPVAVTGNKGILYGFIPDSIKMYLPSKDGENTQDSISLDATVALDLVSTSFDGADGIIPAALLQ